MAAKPGDGYQYHVFLSYSRGTDVETWVHRYFWHQLRLKLTDLLGFPARIFVDQGEIRSGETWARRLVDALRRSYCIVPVWSPAYFTSGWCACEWASFREREKRAGLKTSGLVVPVLWQEETYLPAAARALQYTDLSRFAFTASAFEAASEFLEFEKRIKELVKKEILPALLRAPDFDPGWDVLVPGEDFPLVQDLNARRLEELSDLDAIHVREARPIGRLFLAA